ncbi:MAG: DUF4345 domain-containing protein [Chitinophagaceae bacterium]
MKRNILKFSSKGLILFSALSIAMVSAMAFDDPQAVMNLVGVQLPNNDAYSSIRGVYGGVGLTIFITLIYLAIKDYKKGLVFTSVLWGSYALSRLLTIAVEGSLSAFGNQWLMIESVLCLSSLILLALQAGSSKAAKVAMA